jgi:hypothetical protein
VTVSAGVQRERICIARNENAILDRRSLVVALLDLASEVFSFADLAIDLVAVIEVVCQGSVDLGQGPGRRSPTVTPVREAGRRGVA